LILVSGASGFLGNAVVQALSAVGQPVLAVSRHLPISPPAKHGQLQWMSVGDINGHTEWQVALRGVRAIVHCAARNHVMAEDDGDALAAYREVNVVGTLHLARRAVQEGIRRFVFVSSIKVNGEQTPPGRPFNERSACAPQDAYGQSKAEAEQSLLALAAQTGLELVIIRPPLVCGPGVKGNVARLMKLVSSGVPLPLGAIRNRRSLIGLDNLVDLLIRCVDHPSAAGQTFLVSDGEDLSTPDLLRRIAAAMGRSARLVPVPVSLLRISGSVLGKRAELDRLIGSLQIDSSHTRDVLDWTPPVSVQECIRRMVQSA
jgi:nucleoside-diphosphate-sugar epimerase